MRDIVKKAEEWIKDIHYNADHLIRTGYWAQQLQPDVSDEMLVACITHDAERAFPEGKKLRKPSATPGGIDWADKKHNLWHGKRSAEFVSTFLKEQNMNQQFIDTVVHLIEKHEMGGDEDQNLIQAADSISFLEINGPLFIQKIPEKLTKVQVKEKLDYMYNRIQLNQAKKLAQPFYEKAIKELETIE